MFIFEQILEDMITIQKIRIFGGECMQFKKRLAILKNNINGQQLACPHVMEFISSTETPPTDPYELIFSITSTQISQLFDELYRNISSDEIGFSAIIEMLLLAGKNHDDFALGGFRLGFLPLPYIDIYKRMEGDLLSIQSMDTSTF